MDIGHGIMHCCFLSLETYNINCDLKNAGNLLFLHTHRVEHLRGPPTWQPGMGVHSRTFTGTKLPRACVIGLAQTLRNTFRKLLKNLLLLLLVLDWVIMVTIDVPLILKIGGYYFLRAKYVMGHFKDISRGVKTFLIPKWSCAQRREISGSKRAMNNFGRGGRSAYEFR
jgi:hypothetical protein